MWAIFKQLTVGEKINIENICKPIPFKHTLQSIEGQCTAHTDELNIYFKILL
jgi:hypothetical protein